MFNNNKEQCLTEFEEVYESLSAAERRKVRKHINEILVKLCEHDKDSMERKGSW